MNNIKNYGPFQLWVLNNFPFTIDDWDSITQYQMLCKCLGALKEQLDVNSDLYQKFNALEDYVNNYFVNLDVQEEIDKKLDEMAESGELASIIAEFLETNVVFGFNTVANMKASENLQNGSICKTLGKSTVLDGEGAFYRIRELINTDVIDEVNIIALTNYPTLIAELIPYSNYYAIYNSLNNNIETLETNLINKTDGGHLLVFGDSWTDYNVDVALDGIGWCKALENKTGLTVHNYALNGSAFGNGMFSTQINTFISDTSYDHKLIDKVIFMGGINDYHLNIGGSDTANNYLNVLSNLLTNGNLKENCEIYFINNWSFVNGTYTDATTQITSNDTLELQMNWWHDFFANVQSNENYKTICINTFDWYPYSAWNNTFYHVTESYKTLYQWQQIYSAVYGGQIRKAPYLMKINADFGYVIYKVDNKNSISVIANVWNNQNDMSLTISHNVPYQVDNLKTSNGSVISLNGTSISFTNTGVQQIGYGKFTKYSAYSDIINGSVTAS